MNITEEIFERRAKNAKPEWVADLFQRLVWLLSDNGEEIVQTLGRWVDSGDLERSRVALAFQDVFLFSTRDQMVEAYGRLAARFPQFRTECDATLKRWDNQFAKK